MVILSRRALNRALLERQLLLARSTISAKVLPQYDNVFLSHDDRSRIIRDDVRWSQRSVMEGRFGTVLVDGFIGATWKITRRDGEAMLRVESMVPLGHRDVDAVASEGERLLAFTDGDASHTQ